MTTLQRILHVEDDPDIREIARLALEMMGGFSVLQCESGGEALEKAPGFRPQLLLLDVMMPGMSGEETLAALRNIPETRDCPAIFVTAKAQKAEVERLVESAGAVAVIVKPFDPTTLADEIRAIWARSGAAA